MNKRNTNIKEQDKKERWIETWGGVGLPQGAPRPNLLNWAEENSNAVTSGECRGMEVGSVELLGWG